MQYKVVIQDLKTGVIFEKYFKNEYQLRLFKNKAIRSKKIVILGTTKLY